MGLKLLLIAGHGANDPGACSSYGIERDEARKVVARLVELFKNYKDISVDVYPTNRNCYSDVTTSRVQVNMANYDYVFEVHFNSATASARGTEVWVTPTESSIAVEKRIVDNLSSVGFTNRGVKKEYFAVISFAKNKGVSSALVEVCFISNQNDMNLYRNKFEQVCNAMVSGIADGFGLQKNPGVKNPETKPVDKPSPTPPPTTGFKPYVVKVVNTAIYVLDAPNPDANIVRTVYKGNAYTIVDAKNGYGKLKSGLGWINLSYTSPVATASQTNEFKVKIVNDAIYVIDAPNPNANIKTTIHKNEVYTIVEVSGNYGKLKSGIGWINLSYTSRV